MLKDIKREQRIQRLKDHLSRYDKAGMRESAKGFLRLVYMEAENRSSSQIFRMTMGKDL